MSLISLFWTRFTVPFTCFHGTLHSPKRVFVTLINYELCEGRNMAHSRWPSDAYWVLKTSQMLPQNRYNLRLDPGLLLGNTHVSQQLALNMAFNETESASLLNFQWAMLSKRSWDVSPQDQHFPRFNYIPEEQIKLFRKWFFQITAT